MSKTRQTAESAFWESLQKNGGYYSEYLNRFMNLAVSSFVWTGLPETVDPRTLEMALFFNGQAVFFRDPVIGFIALPARANGPFDIYGNPIERIAYSVKNNYNAFLNESDSVMIYNNMTRTNTAFSVMEFASRLWDIDRTIDVNIKAQKTPVLLQCDETQLLSLKNAYKNFDGNMPVITVDKKFNKDAISCISTGAPFIAPDLQQLKANLWNECLTYLGIPNITINKRERLITDEVSRAQGGVIASRQSRVEERQRACERINNMFGLNVWCEFSEEIADAGNDIGGGDDE